MKQWLQSWFAQNRLFMGMRSCYWWRHYSHCGVLISGEQVSMAFPAIAGPYAAKPGGLSMSVGGGDRRFSFQLWISPACIVRRWACSRAWRQWALYILILNDSFRTYPIRLLFLFAHCNDIAPWQGIVLAVCIKVARLSGLYPHGH